MMTKFAEKYGMRTAAVLLCSVALALPALAQSGTAASGGQDQTQGPPPGGGPGGRRGGGTLKPATGPALQLGERGLELKPHRRQAVANPLRRSRGHLAGDQSPALELLHPF